jgi:tetratricopeptide (TPR) repeat protein
MEDVLRRQQDDPDAYIAMAQTYSENNRGAQAIKTLQDAQAKFPDETSVSFELGAVLDRQKRFAESEAVFRQLITREPNNAAALNYLGYMLAERGERLDESVDYIKRALAIDPDNGSYLDSIGWAYYKDGKFDLALDHLKRAADMLTTNSVVQDHYADLLFRMGRYDAAIEAWNRALSGDGDSIDRGDIDKKIRSAKQKLPRK